MKTYQDYYNEWELSTESRDLAFDEYLMLLLDRKERQMIKKARNWLSENYEDIQCSQGRRDDIARHLDDLGKTMEE